MTNEIHVRTWIDLAKHPVNIERISLKVNVVALGQDDLENIASQNVFLRDLYRTLIHTVWHG